MSADPTTLTGVPATMLLTVAARALAPTARPDLGFRDPCAERIVAQLGVDPAQLCSGEALLVGTVARSLTLDRIARAFFARHPDGLAINLGCGLGTNFDRIADAVGAGCQWLDVDLPDVVAIRRRFFADGDQRRILEGDVCEATLCASLLASERPTLIVAEGLLYYLPPADVEALFRRLAAAANARAVPLEIAFDFASPSGVELSNRLNVDVNRSGARFLWGLSAPDALRAWDPKLTVVEMTGWKEALPEPYAAMFADLEQRDGILPAATLHLRRSNA